MERPKKTDAIERYNAVLGEIKNRSYQEMQTNGYSPEVEKKLMIKELIKEQIPNENTDTTASQTR